jgi:hypothetical protein
MLKPRTSRARNYLHGHATHTARTREYNIWKNMTARCRDPKQARYYGRGIRVCERWRTDFLAFLADMGPSPTPFHSIERINNNGDYEPSNCRWATTTEQANNRRSSRFLEWRGEKLTQAQWATRIGIQQSALWARLKLGWPIERVLTPLSMKALPDVACIECGERKPIAKFRTANVCKRCHRARQRAVQEHDRASPSVEEKSL